MRVETHSLVFIFFLQLVLLDSALTTTRPSCDRRAQAERVNHAEDAGGKSPIAYQKNIINCSKARHPGFAGNKVSQVESR